MIHRFSIDGPCPGSFLEELQPGICSFAWTLDPGGPLGLGGRRNGEKVRVQWDEPMINLIKLFKIDD